MHIFIYCNRNRVSRVMYVNVQCGLIRDPEKWHSVWGEQNANANANTRSMPHHFWVKLKLERIRDYLHSGGSRTCD